MEIIEIINIVSLIANFVCGVALMTATRTIKEQEEIIEEQFNLIEFQLRGLELLKKRLEELQKDSENKEAKRGRKRKDNNI